MSWSLRGRIFLILLAAVVALAFGEVFLSKGMKQAGEGGGNWTAQVVRVLGNPWIWAGGGLLLLHLVLYMAALGLADLSLVLLLTAASYPLTVFLSGRVLGESIGPTRWLGAALITLGVVVVGLGEASGRRREAEATNSGSVSPR